MTKVVYSYCYVQNVKSLVGQFIENVFDLKLDKNIIVRLKPKLVLTPKTLPT